ncbi:outer membrane lipoprotein-sorting protein [bacterium]|nr:outer membrane lipoprotein-sorting protein [bacterium]
MRILSSKTIKILLFIASISIAYCQTKNSAPDIETVIHKIDNLYLSNTSYGEMEMEITTPHWERTLTMTVYTSKRDKSFILITSPKKESGMTTLKIGNEMWNYLPKTDKVIKIPPSMMMSSWMGSDFTNDDLVKESSLLNDYEYKFIYPQNAVDSLLYIQLVPKENTATVWGKIVVWIFKDNYIPIREEFYDEKGKLLRVMTYSEIKNIDGRKIPTLLEMVPKNKEGHKTIIRYKTIKFDINLDKDIFTLRNLKKGK